MVVGDFDGELVSAHIGYIVDKAKYPSARLRDQNGLQRCGGGRVDKDACDAISRVACKSEVASEESRAESMKSS